MVYCYDIRRENAVTGKQSDFIEVYCSYTPLTVGALVLLPGRERWYRILKKIAQFEDFEEVKVS